MNVRVILSSRHGDECSSREDVLSTLPYSSHCSSVVHTQQKSGVSETPLTMPEKTWATLFMLMSGRVLFVSGDVKGLLRCPDMAKAKEIPFHFILISQWFCLESLPFLKLKLPNIYVRTCRIYFRSDLFWKNVVVLKRFAD